MTGFGILVTAVVFAAGAKGGWWLVQRGIQDGDDAMDARTTVACGPDQSLLVEVVNPSGTQIAVGCSTRRRATPAGLQRLLPHLVIRAATRTERRRPDRGASDFLGAVDAGCTRTWRIPCPGEPSRCLVFLGQPGGRLRVHDHAVPPAPTSARIPPGVADHP